MGTRGAFAVSELRSSRNHIYLDLIPCRQNCEMVANYNKDSTSKFNNERAKGTFQIFKITIYLFSIARKKYVCLKISFSIKYNRLISTYPYLVFMFSVNVR